MITPAIGTTDVDPRAAFTAGLRQLADWLELHPEVQLPYIGSYVTGCDLPSLPIYLGQAWGSEDVRTVLADVARAMGNATKATSYGGDYQVWRAFGGLAVYAQADRDEVCDRIVVATHEVTEMVPDPQVVAAAPLVAVVTTVEDVEWRCRPLLAAQSPTTEPTLVGQR